MIDLRLTSDGDIILQEDTDTCRPITLHFKMGSSHAIAFKFAFERHLEPISKGICFSFCIGQYDHYFKEVMITDQEAIKQQAYMVLRTALKEISHDASYGSKLELLKYQSIASSDYLMQAQAAATEALSSLIPKVNVTARFVNNNKGVCMLQFEIRTLDTYFTLDWSE